MNLRRLFFIAPTLPLLALLLASSLVADEPAGGGRPGPKNRTADARSLEGLWSGSWGGGNANGAVMQPVLAEMFLREGFVELSGFPRVGDAAGTARYDENAGTLQITPLKEFPDQEPKVFTLTCRLDGDTLKLTTADNVAVTLLRRPVERRPLANVEVEFVAARGISAAGELLLTRYTVLRVGESFARYFRPSEGSVDTRQATVFQVGEVGLKKITIDEARGKIRAPTLVALAFHHEQRPLAGDGDRLGKSAGPLPPDSVEVTRTLARMLRPGTLLFIVEHSEKIPKP